MVLRATFRTHLYNLGCPLMTRLKFSHKRWQKTNAMSKLMFTWSLIFLRWEITRQTKQIREQPSFSDSAFSKAKHKLFLSHNQPHSFTSTWGHETRKFHHFPPIRDFSAVHTGIGLSPSCTSLGGKHRPIGPLNSVWKNISVRVNC